MNNYTDQIDQKILKILQIDASLSMDEISEKVNLSRNACWRRIRRLESEGIIKGRVAIVEPRSVNLGLSIFVMIKTNSHESVGQRNSKVLFLISQRLWGRIEWLEI